MKKIVLICCFFMSCLPTDKAWKQDFYNNTDCDIYMLINQHQENGVIYPYYGELPLSIDHVDCNLQSSSWAPGRIYYILPYGFFISSSFLFLGRSLPFYFNIFGDGPCPFISRTVPLFLRKKSPIQGLSSHKKFQFFIC